MAVATVPASGESSGDAADRCRFINQRLPEHSLYSDAQRETQPGSRASWRLSPDPFWLPPETVAFLEQLGQDLLAFYRATNSLYFASVRGTQPAWVADYYDRGRPQHLVDYGRLNRTRSHLPRVIRPDLFLTDPSAGSGQAPSAGSGQAPSAGSGQAPSAALPSAALRTGRASAGFVATELDSVPGGIGFGASLAVPYAEMGYPLVGGATGMLDGFAAMLESAAGRPNPSAGIVVSEESGDYWDEMRWLAQALTARGGSVHAVRPQEVRFTEEALHVPEGGSPGPRDATEADPNARLVPIDVLYRFFELYDIKNIPKWELMLYATKKQTVALTPPAKTYLEEKLSFALLHHPALAAFWRQELKPDRFERVKAVLPPTWVLDPRALPPHATVPGIELAGRPVQSWAQLIGLSQKERQLVLKPSGFDATAWGSRGVRVGHDLPEEDWAGAVREALDRFETTRYVLQRFQNIRRATVPWYDFATGEVRRMPGRARLTPYYFVVGDEARLGGVTATVVPIDKKLIHGMVDAVIVPCAVGE